MEVSILVGQFPISFDIKENINNIVTILEKSKMDDLVILPEGALSGYSDDISFLENINLDMLQQGLNRLKQEKTYKKWVCVELSPQNMKQIYIPKGFGHAFLSLEDDTHVVMRIDNYFDSALSRAITYADVELNINFNILNPKKI